MDISASGWFQKDFILFQGLLKDFQEFRGVKAAISELQRKGLQIVFMNFKRI